MSIMRLCVCLVLVVCVFGTQALARRSMDAAMLAPGQKPADAEIIGAAEKAGRTAGAVAGAKAGRETAQKMLNGETQQQIQQELKQESTPNQESSDYGAAVPPVTKKTTTESSGKESKDGRKAPPTRETDPFWLAAAKTDPGAVAFFKEFDADANKHWDEDEWKTAMAAAIKRGYLVKEFDASEAWEKIKKNDDDEIDLQTFLRWSSSVLANRPGHHEPTEAEILQLCAGIFEKFDENKDHFFDDDEFASAVKDKVPEANVPRTWKALCHNEDGHVSVTKWLEFCKKLYTTPKNLTNACNPNPCKVPGTTCVAKQRVCINEPCPQFDCVRKVKGEYGGENPDVYPKKQGDEASVEQKDDIAAEYGANPTAQYGGAAPVRQAPGTYAGAAVPPQKAGVPKAVVPKTPTQKLPEEADPVPGKAGVPVRPGQEEEQSEEAAEAAAPKAGVPKTPAQEQAAEASAPKAGVPKTPAQQQEQSQEAGAPAVVPQQPGAGQAPKVPGAAAAVPQQQQQPSDKKPPATADDDTAGQCVDVFHFFDKDKSNSLNEAEFKRGMKNAQAEGSLPCSVDVGLAWSHLPKTNGELNVEDFTFFCVQLSEQIANKKPVDVAPTSPVAYQGEVAGGSPAQREMWAKSFSKMDADRNGELSKCEFIVGLKALQAEGVAKAVDPAAAWGMLPLTEKSTLTKKHFIDWAVAVIVNGTPAGTGAYQGSEYGYQANQYGGQYGAIATEYGYGASSEYGAYQAQTPPATPNPIPAPKEQVEVSMTLLMDLSSRDAEEFNALFASEMSKSLGVDASRIKVLSVTPAAEPQQETAPPAAQQTASLVEVGAPAPVEIKFAILSGFPPASKVFATLEAQVADPQSPLRSSTQILSKVKPDSIKGKKVVLPPSDTGASPDQRAHWAAEFSKWDEDANGMLSKSEFASGMAKLHKNKIAVNVKTGPAWDSLPKSPSGEVSQKVFVDWASAQIPPAASGSQEARDYWSNQFEKFDLDHSQTLSKDEFMTGMKAQQDEGIADGMDLDKQWNTLQLTEKGEVSKKTFVDFAVQLGQPPKAPEQTNSKARQDCLDVFALWDDDKSGGLSEAEFNLKMMEARRTGRLPEGILIDQVWKKLGKNSNDEIEPKMFADFCVAVSVGDVPKPEPKPTPEYQYMNYQGASDYQAYMRKVEYQRYMSNLEYQYQQKVEYQYQQQVAYQTKVDYLAKLDYQSRVQAEYEAKMEYEAEIEYSKGLEEKIKAEYQAHGNDAAGFPTVEFGMKLDVDVTIASTPAFKQAAAADIAAALGIAASQVQVTGVAAGSVILTVEITPLPLADAPNQPSPVALFQALKRQVANPKSQFATSKLGKAVDPKFKLVAKTKPTKKPTGEYQGGYQGEYQGGYQGGYQSAVNNGYQGSQYGGSNYQANQGANANDQPSASALLALSAEAHARTLLDEDWM